MKEYEYDEINNDLDIPGVYFVLEDTDIWEASDSHRRRFER